MFNREYQRRTARQALERIGLEAVQDNSGFYRPQRRPWPGTKTAVKACKKSSGKLQGVQLELFADHTNISVPATQSLNDRMPDANHPLFDLFPEAYQ